MMRRLLLLPLILAGCIRDADPFTVDTRPLQVHAVLQAGADSATVLLSRPASDRHSYLPVSGAEVYLSHDGGAVRLSEHGGGAACAVSGRTPIGTGLGCYTGALPEPVQPGPVYALEVVLPGGARVTGRTTVPEQLQLTAPEPGVAYAVECAPAQYFSQCRSDFSDEPPYGFVPLAVITLQWESAPDGSLVEALFRPVRVVKDGTAYPGGACEVEPPTLFRAAAASRGSVRWPVHSIYCSGPIDVIGWDTIYMAATVAVYDSAYATYMDAVRGRDAARVQSVSAGLEGALGVFGAVNTTVREVALVRVR